MLMTNVEWDDDKNEVNKREHEGLGFELAQLVFSDPNRLERIDRSDNNVFREE
ncbi:MAG: BrnT family toxin [Treponema sp.]|nr:BrnT family toxin [Treponema sp.]